ncbi:MAG: DUF262 domain-containing protein [Nitrospinales bacterium]
MKKKLKTTCQKFIFQEENEFGGIPNRNRIIYKIRDDVGSFFKEHILKQDSTKSLQINAKRNISVLNMVTAIEVVKRFFVNRNINIGSFSKFVFGKVVLIIVSTKDFDDAFRLFSILNDRGIPLTNSDILKATNVGAIEEGKRDKYARIWEEIESDFGREEFERKGKCPKLS